MKPPKKSSRLKTRVKSAKANPPVQYRSKPTLSIGKGLLIIQDCGDGEVVLDIDAAKELHQLLPGLISILEPLCSGNGRFMFGSVP